MPGFTIDALSTAYAPFTRQKAYVPATTSFSPSTGALSLSQSPDGGTVAMLVAPPTGQQFAAGTTFPVAATATSVAGRLALPVSCPYSASTSGVTGTATVAEAAYTDGVLTALALEYDARCAVGTGTGTFGGSVRYGTLIPYVLGATTVAGTSRVPAATTTPLTVTVRNAGTATTTAGAATVTGPYAADYALGTDGCAGTELDPGETCEVALTFTPPATGERWATLYVPLSGYPRATGTGVVVQGAGVAPPTTATFPDAWPVADGTHLSWSGVFGEVTSYEIYRRPDAGADWATIATPSGPRISFTDTTIEPGTTAQYAIAGVGPGGTGGRSPVATASRAATVPVAGAVDALVLDVTPGGAVASVVHDAATTQRAFQIPLPVFSSVRTGTVVVKVTSSGKTVQVDGLGVRRT